MIHARQAGRAGQHGTLHAPAGYDLATRALFGGQREAFYQRLAAAAGVRAGARVLDLGCGTGAFTRAAAALAGPNGEAVGVDLSDEMIGYARQRGGADFQVMDAARLRFDDESFDVVISALALHHVPWDDRDLVFEQAARVLVRPGRILFLEFVPPAGRLGVQVARKLFNEQMALDPQTDLALRMRRAGFSRIETRGGGLLTQVRAQLR